MEMHKGIPQFDLSAFQGVEISETENEKSLTEEEIEQNNKNYQEMIKREWAESKESGIPERFINSSLDNYNAVTDEEKRNLSVCQNFVENKGRQMLFFIGKYGNGKTHLGCAIVRECVKKGRFTTSFEICTRYEMGGDFKASENRWEVLERFINYDMLVIDEFGRAKPEIERLIIPYIINARYENKKRTVLITNLEKSKAIELLGDASVDRLKEVCSTINFTGESKRH